MGVELLAKFDEECQYVVMLFIHKNYTVLSIPLLTKH